MDEVMKAWQAGIADLDEAAVAIERMRHQTAYMEQQLDRLDAEATPKRGYLRTLLGGTA